MQLTQSDNRSFLEAIIADPANDLPRLVYADWLEENGESQRAKFIRYQIERNSTGICICGPEGLREGKCQSCTIFNLRAGTGLHYVTSRGFIVQLHGPLACLLEHGPPIVAMNPVESVIVTRITVNEIIYHDAFLRHAVEMTRRGFMESDSEHDVIATATLAELLSRAKEYSLSESALKTR